MLVRFLEASREHRRLDGEHRDRKSISMAESPAVRKLGSPVLGSFANNPLAHEGGALNQVNEVIIAPEVAAEIEQENETRNERKSIRVN